MQHRQLVLFIVPVILIGCTSSGVGDPCVPESEFSPSYGQATFAELGVDVNSVQCSTRVCLQHYFRGRVTCPYGNSQEGQLLQDAQNNAVRCKQVQGYPGYYTINGVKGAALCCPQQGDTAEKPVTSFVDAQCKERPASDAVYCSCRCDVPNDPDIDRSQVNLCKCPEDFECKPLCDKDNGNCQFQPKGKWGSYCVKKGKNGSDFDSSKAESLCTQSLQPPK